MDEAFSLYEPEIIFEEIDNQRKRKMYGNSNDNNDNTARAGTSSGINEDAITVSIMQARTAVMEGAKKPKTSCPMNMYQFILILDEAHKNSRSTIRNRNSHAQLMYMILKNMDDSEQNNTSFQFSKEALKYYLASYAPFVKVTDLGDTNEPRIKKRSNKQETLLPTGGILSKYAKGLDTFFASIDTADRDDLRALRLIIEDNYQLSPTIYDVTWQLNFQDAVYETETVRTIRDDYIFIPITNGKRATVLVTRYIIMLYDGHQFVLPPIGLERDIPTKVLLALQEDEYVLFDMLLSAKNRVIDVIEINMNNENLPDQFRERLKFVERLFPSLNIVKPNSTNINGSYIQKPLLGFGTSYIFSAPNPVAAIVGTTGKEACLAFRADEHTLIVKLECKISGPASLYITTATRQRSNAGRSAIVGETILPIASTSTQFSVPSSQRMINHGTRTYRVIGKNLENVDLFNEVITVELKDGNKIGNLSAFNISHKNEYELPSTQENTISSEVMMSRIMENPLQFYQILSESKKLEEFMQELLTSYIASKGKRE